MKGSTSRHGDGWRYRIYLGIVEGKKKYATSKTFRTKKEAESACAKHIVELETGVYVEPSKELLKEFLDRWLGIKKTQIRAGTWRQYDWLLRLHVVPYLGNIRIEKLRGDHIQNLYVQLTISENAISKRTVGHLHRVLKQAFDHAVKWGLIVRNPLQIVTPPKPDRVEMHVWNADQVTQFLSIAKKRTSYYTAFLLLVSTGLRLGEVLGLQWDDVDLISGVIQVRRTLSYVGKGYMFEDPKTISGKRTVDLSFSIVDELRKHKTQQAKLRLSKGAEWKNHDLVICTSNGTPVLQSNLRMLFSRLCKKADVPVIRIHDLRHTHATILLQREVHPKIVQERLGHRDIQTTLNTYSHVMPGMQAKAAAKMDDIFQNVTDDRKDAR